MDWKDIADLAVSILGGILALPFLLGILILLLCIFLYGLKLIAAAVDSVLSLFHLETRLQDTATRALIWLIDLILAIPALLKRTWKVTKIVLAILFVLSLWMTPYILNHCSSSSHTDNEYEDKYYEPGKLRPDKF
ncbi:MAG: hypothetical protein IJV19_06535 [Prevotella sp.]|nr:hypothetical protein [Prevotella sp.]